MQFKSLYLGLVSTFALAACGGSGSDPVANVEYLSDAADILDTVQDLPPFDPIGLQASGSATYTGGLSVFHKADDMLLGVMTLNVDFGADTFDGSAERFIDGDRTTFDGSLSITEGIIDRGGDFSADYSATALIDGTLTSTRETVDITGFVVGDFAGTDGDYYRGFLRIGLNGDTYEDGDPFGGVVGARQD